MPNTITVKRGDYLRVSFKVKDWSPEILQALDEAEPGTSEKCTHVYPAFYSSTTLIPRWSHGLMPQKPVERPGQTLTWTIRIPKEPEDFRPGTYSIRANYMPERGASSQTFARILDDILVDIQ